MNGIKNGNQTSNQVAFMVFESRGAVDDVNVMFDSKREKYGC